MDGFKKNLIGAGSIFREKVFFIFLFSLALMLNGCATDEGVPVGSEVTMVPTTFPSHMKDLQIDRFPEYLIQAGDTLDILFAIKALEGKEEFKLQSDHTLAIKFPQIPEFNEVQRILPDGTISLPLIGNINIVGRTIHELTEELKNLYGKILKNPEIYISVPEFRERIKDLKTDLHTAPRGLSRLVTVRPDGYCTFPMVGGILVSGKTIENVNKYLNKRYEEIFPGLHVDLFLEKGSGFLVYVAGQVQKPGAYPIIKPITVLHALTLAGSFLPGAQLDSIMVVRRDQEKMKILAIRVDLKSSLELKCQQQVFYLRPDDVVYVPKTWITKTAEIMNDVWTITNFKGYNAGFGFSYELYKLPVKTQSTNPAVLGQ